MTPAEHLRAAAKWYTDLSPAEKEKLNKHVDEIIERAREQTKKHIAMFDEMLKRKVCPRCEGSGKVWKGPFNLFPFRCGNCRGEGKI